MSLYNVIDDISKKQITKTPMGDNRIYGVVVATVVNNYNEKMPGRVCISVINRNEKVTGENPGDFLKWARVAMLSSGKGWGHYFLPEVGDQVLVVFEEGNIEKPYIIGCLPRVNDRFFTESVHEKNIYKSIQTKYGSHIRFTDGEINENNNENKGDKDVIEIMTANKEHKITMDNARDKIIISDKDGSNSIEMSTKEDENGPKGSITIKTDTKLFIKVGEGVKVTMTSDANGGSILVDTKNVTFKTSGSFKISSTERVDISGNGIKAESTSGLDLNGQSTVSIDGGAISIG